MHFVIIFSKCNNLLHNAAKFITKCVGAVNTKCGSLLQNAALLQNEMKKLLHFGRLLQNAAQQP